MVSAKVALRPNSEAPRQSGKTERGTTNFINHDDDTDSIKARRAQFLVEHFGLTAARAAIVATLFWGGSHG